MIDLSIIVPIRNTGLYLRDCIESIIGQNMDNYELILVDDGSTDNSYEICVEYSKKYSFIKVLEAGGNGVSHARNVGQNAATGEYLYFMDSDDTLEKGDFKSAFSYVMSTKPDLYIFSSNRIVSGLREDYGMYDENEYSTGKDAFVKLRKEKNYYTLIYNLVISRKVIFNNSITWKEGIIQEDHLYIFYVFMNSRKTISEKKRIYNYYVRDNSIMNSDIAHRRFDGYGTCALEIINYFESGTFDNSVSEAIYSYIKYLVHLASYQYFWSDAAVDESIYKKFKETACNLKYSDMGDIMVFRLKKPIRYIHGMINRYWRKRDV